MSIFGIILQQGLEVVSIDYLKQTYDVVVFYFFQYKLTVPKLGIVLDLCKALSKLTGIKPDKVCT